jgi:hypothetical protein
MVVRRLTVGWLIKAVARRPLTACGICVAALRQTAGMTSRGRKAAATSTIVPLSTRAARLVAAAFVCASSAAACAADPGDAPKTSSDGPTMSGNDASFDAGMDQVDAHVASDSSILPPVDALAESAADAPPDVAPVDARAEVGVVDAGPDVIVDGAACLGSIPASCPDCMTQNASDKPICEQYIQCFLAQGCDPHTACGSSTGVCGVNTIGGGAAPYTAAVATYDCACP